jgi:hypothetical protein
MGQYSLASIKTSEAMEAHVRSMIDTFQTE